jgi:superfamily II DNA or RNA helicase
MIMACGTGKTFTTLWIKEAMGAQTTLVLLPSLNLLSQTMREWSWGSNSDFDILNVCSDKSVGKASEDMSAAEAPFPVTSEPEEIAAFLKKPSRKVLFCTYQSSPLIAEVQQDKSLPTFDLAIADEAHRCAGKADASFSTILDASKIRSNKRLFTTATPRYFGKNVRDAAKLRDQEIVGMDDEDVFGPVIHTLTFGEAIQRQLLNDYQVVVVGVDEPRVKALIENKEIISTDPEKNTDARTLAAKIGLIKAIKDYDLKRVISFHSRVKGAREFSEEFEDVVGLIKSDERPQGVFLSDFVSGEMKTGDRLDKIQQLKSLDAYDRGVICNARCLAEGVDVPSLDGIAFIDPRGSQIEIIQAVGRAIRKVRDAKLQTKGTIVIPVFIEEGESAEASIEASNFKPVWDVLNALRAHDETLAETLDQYRAALAQSASNSKAHIDKVVFDLPASIGAGFAAALRTLVVEASTSSWEFWFEKLKDYREEKGDCSVPKQFLTEDGFKLGGWVQNQRARHEQLPLERRARLTALGFIWDPHEARWEEGFKHLVQYKEEAGDCLVHNKLKTENGFPLGQWVAVQRTAKWLSPERLERLQILGFIWDASEYKWQQGLGHLQHYNKKHGDCLVPNEFLTDDGYALGKWVSRLRSRKKTLSPKQLEKLEELDFVWNKFEHQWQQGLGHLRRYKEKHGDCLVPNEFLTDDGYALGNWVARLRSRKKMLSPKQLEKLEELDFVWNKFEHQWQQGLGHLRRYKEKHGDCLVPNEFLTDDGYALGKWVSRLRGRKKTLSSKQLEKLEELNFVWDALEHKWEEGFQHLKIYKQDNGNCLVPNELETTSGFKLGQWVAVQRVDKETIGEVRVGRLNALGFIWDVLEHQWEEGFEQLKNYRDNHGNCLVSQRFVSTGGFKLGQWVTVQRTRQKQLMRGRKKRLDELGFIWDLNEHLWEEGFKHLTNYKENNGNCLVSSTYKTKNDFSLGQWVGVQRRKNNQLTPNRKKRLEALGFIWDVLKHQWDEGFEQLKSYKKANGHCLVPKDFVTENGFNLGAWASRQRGKKKSLTSIQIQKLSELSFVWNTLDQQWEEGFKSLKKYKEEIGDCLVPHDYRDPDDFKLGYWVATQRSNKNNSIERKKRLNELGFVWNIKLFQWQIGFEYLKHYKEITGNCLVPHDFETIEGFKLGYWVANQRQRKLKLARDQFDQLNALKFFES